MRVKMNRDHTMQVVVGCRDGGVAAFKLDLGKLTQMFSVKLEDVVPVAVDFEDNHTMDVFVFGRFNGLM